MRKVKILEIYGHHDGYYGETHYYPSKETVWDMVTDEECELLQEWVRDANKDYSYGGYYGGQNKSTCYYVLAQESKLDIPYTIEQALANAKKKQADAAAKKAKAEAVAKKRAATIAKKREADDKAKLRELLKRFPKDI